jgi:hypothetical protein
MPAGIGEGPGRGGQLDDPKKQDRPGVILEAAKIRHERLLSSGFGRDRDCVVRGSGRRDRKTRRSRQLVVRPTSIHDVA